MLDYIQNLYQKLIVNILIWIKIYIENGNYNRVLYQTTNEITSIEEPKGIWLLNYHLKSVLNPNLAQTLIETTKVTTSTQIK